MATNLLCEGSASGLSIDSAFQPDKEKNYIYMPIYNLKLDDPFMCWCSWLIFIIFGLSTAGLQILSNAHKALCSSYCYASRGCIPTRTRLHKIKDWHVHPQQLPTLLNCRPVEPRKNSYVVKLGHSFTKAKLVSSALCSEDSVPEQTPTYFRLKICHQRNHLST